MLKLSGLWKKTREDGYTYYTGKINDYTRVVVFPNIKKTSDSQPDFEVFLDDTKGSDRPTVPGSAGMVVVPGVRQFAPKKETEEEPGV